MTDDAQINAPRHTAGLILHQAWRYDLTVWLLTRGRERAFRESIAHLARLRPGQSVLDVGCGTGSLAIVAKKRVGSKGTVHGIDASDEMLARAKKKARKAGADITFELGLAQSLPFPDSHFDVVTNTVMLHHLPRKARALCAAEMRRVTRPGGHVLVIEFAGASEKRRSFLSHFHRHGHVKPDDIADLLHQAGLEAIESGALGLSNLQFVLTTPRRV